MAPSVEGEVGAAAGRQLAGDVAQVGAAGDALVGDGVESRERRPHTNCWPALTPRPRIQSAAGMRDLPVGCTSPTTTAPSPAATSSRSPVSRTVPGLPAPLAAPARNSLTSWPSSVVQAPGFGSSA